MTIEPVDTFSKYVVDIIEYDEMGSRIKGNKYFDTIKQAKSFCTRYNKKNENYKAQPVGWQSYPLYSDIYLKIRSMK